jgi:OmcA/MtrC family decaheme c-type cytochrome
MKIRKSYPAFLILFLLGVGLTIAGDGIKPTYTSSEKAYYLTDAQASFVRPGLKLVIQKVEFDPLPNVSVTFRISDDADQPLDRLGIQTPGTVVMQFILSRIRPGDTQYTNYVLRTFNSALLGTVQDPWSDPANATDSAYTDLGNGVYKYTLAQKLPPDFDVNSTTTIGVQAGRDLTGFGLKRYVANATLDFVPSGAPVTQVRDVVRIENCNQCHDPLAWHGGGDRRDTKLCVLCHTPQNRDPVTGGTLDFKVIVHKIHMGARLPSVSGTALNVLGVSGIKPTGSTATIATGATPAPLPPGYKAPSGKPAIINGDDVSNIVFPQDVRNCTTCHKGGSQSDNWKNNPSRAACGSCHDDVDFATGKNHDGGVQTDDSKCSTCHPADTGLEFDLSVAGVHTMPWKSKQLKGLKVAITGITAQPGSKPTVTFTVTDNANNPVALSGLGRLYFTISGPTSDYAYLLPATGFQGVFGNTPGNNPWQENALLTATSGPSGGSYTFVASLPSDATGTWAIGAEAFRDVAISGSLVGQTFTVREFAYNPVYYFSVDGSAVVPRRKVVDVLTKCNVCHETFAFHGGSRRNATEYCELCHNPNHVDEPPKGQTPTAVNFRTMVMGIHMSDQLDEPLLVNTRNYKGLRFPGDPRDCAKCHVTDPAPTFTVPVPDGLIPTVDPSFFYSPLQPTASACLGCHNGEDAAAHAYQMTAPFGESCPVCHQEGADFAVTKVHAH